MEFQLQDIIVHVKEKVLRCSQVNAVATMFLKNLCPRKCSFSMTLTASGIFENIRCSQGHLRQHFRETRRLHIILYYIISHEKPINNPSSQTGSLATARGSVSASF